MLPTTRPFLSLTLISLSILSSTTAALQPCRKPPSWTLRNLNIATRDEVGSDGTATSTFTYDLTNRTEPIACPLHSNYRCTITGTRNDNSTVIDLQLGLGTLYTTVIQVLDCGVSGPYVNFL
ncbi:hypothetical protein F5B17DRAFT_450252 [Nemania serpens]|nr:hypothetical protein F5B17DRAFT_450252 [Nemania serpens]